MPKDYYRMRITDQTGVPFKTAEEAWFWFIQAYQARVEGARIVAGQGLIKRPCEPLDILKIVDRLYRNRVLVMDHMRVLRHYGERVMAPDPTRRREVRAHMLWREAFEKITPIMVDKGIVIANHWMYDTPNVVPIRPYIGCGASDARVGV